MPELIASWLKLTSAPRYLGGAASPMYMGTTIDAEPTARPMTTRAPSRNPNTGENAAQSTPTTKTAAVTRIVGRRPIRSATRPAPIAPAAAPTSSKLVTSSLSNEEICGKESFKNNRAPDTTPVS
jgi:hypothetical protein